MKLTARAQRRRHVPLAGPADVVSAPWTWAPQPGSDGLFSAPVGARVRVALPRCLLIAAAIMVFSLVLALPLAVLATEALRQGWNAYAAALTAPATLAALRLSLGVVAVVVPLSTGFGLAAAWALSRYRFPGRELLRLASSLPFAVPPVVAGLVFVLLFGRRGWAGPWLLAHHIKIIFAWPGIILATLFVCLPFVFKPLLPLLESQGASEEEAALLLGANGWQIFRLVTWPKIRWALLGSSSLCAARALGEFGAVSVVSGHIRGLTETLPLHVEILYNEYHFAAAYGVASMMAILALISVPLRAYCERRYES